MENKDPLENIGTMKQGDYMIHVFIEEGKSFVLEANENKKQFNALLRLNSGSSKNQFSKSIDCPVQSDAKQNWGEHFFFEKIGMTSDQIQQEVLEIRIMDKGMLRDTVVGIFDIDISQVYFKDKHAIQNQWVAFGSESNATNADADGKIKGIVQVSIAVQGPGDNAVVLQEAQGLENSEEAEVLMPASIRKAYK